VVVERAAPPAPPAPPEWQQQQQQHQQQWGKVSPPAGHL
jgi:hypothetical protein